MTRRAQAAGAQVLIVGMQVPPNYGRDYAQDFEASSPRGQGRRRGAGALPACRAWPTRRNAASCSRPTASTRTAAAQPRILDNVWPALRTLLR